MYRGGARLRELHACGGGGGAGVCVCNARLRGGLRSCGGVAAQPGRRASLGRAGPWAAPGGRACP